LKKPTAPKATTAPTTETSHQQPHQQPKPRTNNRQPTPALQTLKKNCKRNLNTLQNKFFALFWATKMRPEKTIWEAKGYQNAPGEDNLGAKNPGKNLKGDAWQNK
jgi:hypothetical protein